MRKLSWQDIQSKDNYINLAVAIEEAGGASEVVLQAELPKGPEAAVYNDWAEVVTSCQNAAYYHSLRKYEYVKPECRSS